MDNTRSTVGTRGKLSASLLCLSLGTLLGSCVGCRVERAPTREESHELSLARMANDPLPILPQPEGDDAMRVTEACGRPNVDVVTPVYSKYYNGPVRHMEYVGQRRVTLDFIPAGPPARLAFTEAPLSPRDDGEERSPANITWRFQAGQMAQVTMITAHRLSLFLPCAGDALSGEF